MYMFNKLRSLNRTQKISENTNAFTLAEVFLPFFAGCRKTAFTLAEFFSPHFAGCRKTAFTLAEFFSPHFAGRRKSAFTLAEILVTLGIIGVVAAMTLPTVINNIQKQTLKKQFLTNFSLISQALEKAQADLQYIPECWYWDTGTFSQQGEGGQGKFSECYTLKKAFLDNLKIIKSCSNNSLLNGCIPDYKGWDTLQSEVNENFQAGFGCANEHKPALDTVSDSYILPNGAILINMVKPGATYGQYGENSNGVSYGNMDFNVFALDINGKKGPNKWGYDLFELAFWGNKNKPIYIRTGICNPTDKGGISANELIKNMHK